MEVLGFYYVLQDVRLCNLNPLSELQGVSMTSRILPLGLGKGFFNSMEQLAVPSQRNLLRENKVSHLPYTEWDPA